MKIACVLLSLLAVVCSASAGPIDAREIASIKAEIAKRAAGDEFSGAVLICRGQHTWLEAAYNYANREDKVRNTPQTRFRFGSMGKMFTAVAIMQLIESGNVSLTDPISKFLPDYPNPEVAKVTVEQLLTHTAGTGDIFGPEFMEHRLELKELSDYVQLYGKRGLRFAPGSQHEYSNYGFILLGRIIETVSGQSYYDFVREHVFEPAGMTSTDNLPENTQIANLAVAYTHAETLGPRTRGPGPGEGQGAGRGPGPGPGPGRPPSDNGPLRPADDLLPYRGTSAGGGYTTVSDLAKFATALLNHQLVNPELTTLMTTGKVNTPNPGLKYAYGFEDETTPEGERRIGHGGGAPGMNGLLWIYPTSNVFVVVLANLDPPAAQDVGHFIAEQLATK
ncbi:MAG: serine hydrolase domain-containing protein [Povalibacter sp.]